MSEGTDGTTEPQAVEPAKVETSTAETPSTETAKEVTETEGTEPEGSEPEASEETEKPKRQSGYDRMKRKNQYLQSEILRLQEQASKPAAEEANAPREEDFNGDWGKYIAATAAHEAAKAVKGSLAEDKKSAQQARVAELQSEVMADFHERTEAFKAKATDFDDVVSGFVNKGGKFTDAVRELVMESDVGPQLTYHIAKHPAIANKLNSLPPLQAAKEIARLEDSLSNTSRKATNAPPPITPPKGGAGPSVDPATGPDDMAAFASWLNKDLAKRRGR
jgi:hypothetical protein